MTVATIKGGNLENVKQLEVPKVYSACISAKYHHSGYHLEEPENSGADHDNSYYTTIIAQSNQTIDNSLTSPADDSLMFKFQKHFGAGADSDEEEEVKKGGEYFFIQGI